MSSLNFDSLNFDSAVIGSSYWDFMNGNYGSISCRPASALSSVFWSAYSRAPPTGKPRARRVMRTCNGDICWRRYMAVASPSMLGFVA